MVEIAENKLAILAYELFCRAENNTVDDVVRPINSELRLTQLGCESYQNASCLRDAAGVVYAIANFPDEKFSVFKHTQDNEGTIRIDIRRTGTFSPYCWGDSSEARARAKSHDMANVIANEFSKTLERVGKLAK